MPKDRNCTASTLFTARPQTTMGTYGIFFFPSAVYTDHEEARHEQGEYYHVAVMFTDKHLLEFVRNRNDSGSSDAHYTRAAPFARITRKTR